MYYTIKMGDKQDVYVDVSPDVIEMLKQLNMYDVLMNRFLGSGDAVKAMTEEWEKFRNDIQKMINGLPEQDRNYAVNYGGYPMKSVFLANTCVAFMNEVAEEAKNDDTLFDNKFSGLLAQDVFQRWLKRLKKTANKVLGTVKAKKAELYSVVITKIIERTTKEMGEEMADKDLLLGEISKKLTGVLKCIYDEQDHAKLAEEVNEYIWSDGYRINYGINRPGFDIFIV